MRNQERERERGAIWARVEGKLDSLTESVRKVADEWMTYQLRREGRGRMSHATNNPTSWFYVSASASVCVSVLSLSLEEPTPILGPHLYLIRYNLCVIEWGKREKGEKAISIDIRQQPLVHFVNTHSPEGRFSLSLSLSLSLSQCFPSLEPPPGPASTFGP